MHSLLITVLRTVNQPKRLLARLQIVAAFLYSAFAKSLLLLKFFLKALSQ